MWMGLILSMSPNSNIWDVFYESGTDGVECSGMVASAIGSLVNAGGLQNECAGVLHETLLVPVLTYVSEAILWREKERSRIYIWIDVSLTKCRIQSCFILHVGM